MPDSQVDEVKSKIDIVSIIGEHVKLNKSGSNFKGLCPFHQEKTPSFMVSPELQIYKCFGCFPAGQFVKTPFGYHKIEDITENEYVFSGQGNLKKVLVTHEKDYRGKLVIVKTGQLTEPVKLTEDHNVYIIGGSKLYKNNFKYLSKRLNSYNKYSKEERIDKALKYFPIEKINAGSLSKGMSLLYPIDQTVTSLQTLDLSEYITKTWPKHGKKPSIPELSMEIDSNLLKLIGYYIAEGSNHRAYIRFSLSSDEEDFAQEIIDLGIKVFNIKGSIFKRPSKNGIEVTICNSVLANILENLCGKGTQNKHIPFIFQQLAFDKQMILLMAIHKGDGFEPRISSRVKTKRFSITTISRTLAEQLTDILLRNGYFPSRNISKEHIDKKNLHHKKAFTVSWAINPTVSKSHHIYETKEGNFYWILPIRKIKKEKFEGKVHNLTIEDDHSYVANNFAVANCGEGGDVFTFLEKYEGMEFSEALRFLAEKSGVVLTQNDSFARGEKDILFEINALAAKFYNYLLLNHQVGKIALNYLKEERKLSLDSIKIFNIGFAPNNKNSLSDYLIKKKKFKVKDIERAGVIYVTKYGKVYDRFEGRIIFPISDHRGNVIALAGRILPPGRRDVGKYINSPETDIYHKSSSLFGLNITKDFIKREGFAVVVEGELDLISSFQVGIKNIVAIKGSAFTVDQARLLSRYTNEVVLALDSDFAGVAASIRGIKILEDAGFEVKVVKFGIYKDPDEAALKNPEFLKTEIKNAVPVWDFIIDSILAKYDKTSSSGKRNITKELLPLLSQIDNKILQEHYIKKLSEMLDVSEEAVITEVQKQPSITPKTLNITVSQSRNIDIAELREERFISLILKISPKLIKDEKVHSLVQTPILKKIIAEFNLNDITGKNLPRELFDKFAELNLVDFDSEKEAKIEINNLYALLAKEKFKALYLKETDTQKRKFYQDQHKLFESGDFERII